VAFRLLHRALERRLRERRLSVVDATNLERHARIAILRRALAAGLPSVAIVLDVPLHTALARNRVRPGRTVDEAVVRHQRTLLDGVLARGALDAEGHTLVVVLDPVAADSVIVRRRS